MTRKTISNLKLIRNMNFQEKTQHNQVEFVWLNVRDDNSNRTNKQIDTAKDQCITNHDSRKEQCFKALQIMIVVTEHGSVITNGKIDENGWENPRNTERNRQRNHPKL